MRCDDRFFIVGHIRKSRPCSNSHACSVMMVNEDQVVDDFYQKALKSLIEYLYPFLLLRSR